MEETELEYFVGNLTMLSSVDYDQICRDVVQRFRLDKRCRKQDLKDRCQYFFKWWYENKDKMTEYTTLEKVGKLCNLDHTSVLSSIKKRKPSWAYEENTARIKSYLINCK